MSDAAGERFSRLVEIMKTLRAPGGCPWDREQTLESLRPFVLEEAHEVADAIDEGDSAALRDEIGDLVFEGVFLAEVLSEQDSACDIAAALDCITQKLIRRHPHVFSADGTPASPDRQLGTAGAVVEQWDEIKARERAAAGQRPTLLKGIPRSTPALKRAFTISNRAASVGFDWAQAPDVVDKIQEEVNELRQAVYRESEKRQEEEMGDLLFAIANLSRKLGIEPEAALQQANDKFVRRFSEIERRFEERGRALKDSTLEEMEEEWEEVKKNSEI